MESRSTAVVIAVTAAWPLFTAAQDCNRNGIPDAIDLRPENPGFAATAELPLAGIPIWVAGDDLDGDGDTDALVTSGQNPWDADRLTVFRNDGRGSLTAQPSTEAQARSNIAIADLDGDGDLDAALPLIGGRFGVFRNDGAGSFSFAPTPSEAALHQWLVCSDLDHDGDIDVVATTFSPHRVVVYANRGAGEFSVVSAIPFDHFLYQVVVADLDGDGASDLAVGSYEAHQLVTLLGKGDGTFGPPPAPVALGFEPAFLAQGDIEPDGDTDVLAVGDGSQQIAILENDGRGRFTGREEWIGRDMRAIHALDLDGDADVDFLTVNWRGACGENGSISLVHNVGDGGLEETSNIEAPISVRSLVARDLDGDGRRDLVLGPVSKALAVLRGEAVPHSADCDADGIPDECELAELDCNLNQRLDVCDIRDGSSADCDGDGLPDECEPDCNHDSLPDDCDLAAGTSQDADHSHIPDECEAPAPRLPADCDGDGRTDVDEIAAGASSDCNSSGVPDTCEVETAVLPRYGRFPLGFEPAERSLAADLNGDGLTDFVAMRRGSFCAPLEPDRAVVYLKTGPDRGWREAGDYAAGRGAAPVVAGDLEGDGDVDILMLDFAPAGPSRHRLRPWRNLGRGALVPLPAMDLGLFVQDVKAADLDGDGDLDIAATVFDPGNGRIVWLRNAGGGGFETGGVIPVADPAALALSDLDSDGDVDAMAVSAPQGAPSTLVLFLQSGGAFRAMDELPLGAGRAAIASSDLDRDGLPDIAVAGAGEAGRELLVLWNGPGLRFVPGSTLALPMVAREVFPADKDGDGDLDIAVFGQYAPVDLPTGVWVFSLYFQSGPRDFFGPRLALLGAYEPLGFPIAADRDAELELAAYDYASQSVAVLENSLGHSVLHTGGRPRALAVADFDADDDSDILLSIDTSDGAGEVAVIANDDRTGFRRALSVGLSSASPSVAVGDLDRDGDIDVAVVQRLEVLVLRNDGAGGLAADGAVRADSNPIAVAVSDLDGDGDSDLATANSLGGEVPFDNLSVFLNAGAGAFGPARNYAIGGRSGAIFARDVDGDAGADITVSHLDSPTASVFHGAGGGMFSLARPIDLGVTPAALVLADMDGDGEPEIVASDGATIAMAENLGGGAFAPPNFLRVGEPFFRDAFDMTALDADGDGDQDLLAAEPYRLHLFPNRRRELPASPQTFLWHLGYAGQGGSGDPPPPNEVRLAWADFDRNGTPDPVMAAADQTTLAVFYTRYEPRAGDADGDGLPDDCESEQSLPFRRGDANADGSVDISDAITVLRHLFITGESFACEDAADADDSGSLDLTDAIRVLLSLFAGGDPLPAPAEECGEEVTVDALGCDAFPACPQRGG